MIANDAQMTTDGFVQPILRSSQARRWNESWKKYSLNTNGA